MLTATVLALAAAGLHATWNLILKGSAHHDVRVASWGLYAVGALVALPGLVFVGLPGWDVAPWLLLSVLVHVVYAWALLRAYGAGDFSLTYPMARGAGALLSAVGGVLLLGDVLSPLAWLAALVVVAALLSLVGRGVHRPAVGWALATAATIGSYAVVDAHASRLSPTGVSYGLTLAVACGVGLTVQGLALGRAGALARAVRADPRRYLIGGTCMTAAYSMVLVAFRLAPVGYVAMLRESSVVIGALMGWLALHERFGRRRVVSSGVMVCGLVLLVAAGR